MDWMVKLVDVHPTGEAYNICEGIVRCNLQARKPQIAPRPSLLICGFALATLLSFALVARI
jgi:predicted acyl esterase